MYQENRERKMRRDFARIVIRSRMYYSLSHACITSHLVQIHKAHTSSHPSDGGRTRTWAYKPQGGSVRGQEPGVHTREFASTRSLRERKTQNAGASNGYRIAGCRVPFPTPSSARTPFLPFRMGPLFLIHPCPSSLVSHSSLFSSFALESFLSYFLPPPSPSRRPLIPDVRTPAYTSYYSTYYMYYALLLTLAYYYEQWRIDDLPPRSLPSRVTVRFLSGNFRKNALRSDAIYACYFLPASSSRTQHITRRTLNFNSACCLVCIYFIYQLSPSILLPNFLF